MRSRIARNGYFSVVPKPERPIGAALAQALKTKPVASPPPPMADGEDDEPLEAAEVPSETEEQIVEEHEPPAPKGAKARQQTKFFDSDME
jgi:hypothetical protein